MYIYICPEYVDIVSDCANGRNRPLILLCLLTMTMAMMMLMLMLMLMMMMMMIAQKPFGATARSQSR